MVDPNSHYETSQIEELVLMKPQFIAPLPGILHAHNSNDSSVASPIHY